MAFPAQAQDLASLNRLVANKVCPGELAHYALPDLKKECPHANTNYCKVFDEACFHQEKLCSDEFSRRLNTILKYNNHIDRCRNMARRASALPITPSRVPTYKPPASANAPDELTLNITSNHRYIVQASLYSKNRSHEWPGGGKAYTITDSDAHSYKISCEPGEKICYGAWDKTKTSVHWGNGHDGDDGCENCCMTCGSGTMTVRLNDASDLVDNDGDGGSAISDMFNAYVAGNSRTISRSNRAHTNPVQQAPSRQYGSRPACVGPGTCSAQ